MLYIPLSAITELFSAICDITNLTMFVTTLLSIISSVITGGLSALVEITLKKALKELFLLALGYVVPSVYDITRMLVHACQKKGCTYIFKYFGGGTIALN